MRCFISPLSRPIAARIAPVRTLASPPTPFLAATFAPPCDYASLQCRSLTTMAGKHDFHPLARAVMKAPSVPSAALHSPQPVLLRFHTMGLSRAFSTEAKDGAPKAEESTNNKPFKNLPQRLSNAWTEIREHSYRYGVIAGAGAFVILLTASGWKIAKFFSTIHFVDVGHAMFWTGCLTTLAAGYAVRRLGWLIALKPEPVYNETSQIVLKDQRVQQALGGNVKVGAFRAYTFTTAGVTMPGVPVDKERQSIIERIRTSWKPQKLQMLFQVNGKKKGMISAEVQRKGTGFHFNILALDVLDTGEKIILQGDEELAGTVFKGITQLR